MKKMQTSMKIHFKKIMMLKKTQITCPQTKIFLLII